MGGQKLTVQNPQNSWANFTFDQLDKAVSGTYNKGELRLTDSGQLTTINNHVFFRLANIRTNTAQQNNEVRLAVASALTNWVQGQDAKTREAMAAVLALIREQLLGKDFSSALSRDEVRMMIQLLKASKPSDGLSSLIGDRAKAVGFDFKGTVRELLSASRDIKLSATKDEAERRLGQLYTKVFGADPPAGDQDEAVKIGEEIKKVKRDKLNLGTFVKGSTKGNDAVFLRSSHLGQARSEADVSSQLERDFAALADKNRRTPQALGEFAEKMYAYVANRQQIKDYIGVPEKWKGLLGAKTLADFKTAVRTGIENGLSDGGIVFESIRSKTDSHIRKSLELEAKSAELKSVLAKEVAVKSETLAENIGKIDEEIRRIESRIPASIFGADGKSWMGPIKEEGLKRWTNHLKLTFGGTFGGKTGSKWAERMRCSEVLGYLDDTFEFADYVRRNRVDVSKFSQSESAILSRMDVPVKVIDKLFEFSRRIDDIDRGVDFSPLKPKDTNSNGVISEKEEEELKRKKAEQQKVLDKCLQRLGDEKEQAAFKSMADELENLVNTFNGQDDPLSSDLSARLKALASKFREYEVLGQAAKGSGDKSGQILKFGGKSYDSSQLYKFFHDIGNEVYKLIDGSASSMAELFDKYQHLHADNEAEVKNLNNDCAALQRLYVRRDQLACIQDVQSALGGKADLSLTARQLNAGLAELGRSDESRILAKEILSSLSGTSDPSPYLGRLDADLAEKVKVALGNLKGQVDSKGVRAGGGTLADVALIVNVVGTLADDKSPQVLKSGDLHEVQSGRFRMYAELRQNPEGEVHDAKSVFDALVGDGRKWVADKFDAAWKMNFGLEHIVEKCASRSESFAAFLGEWNEGLASAAGFCEGRIVGDSELKLVNRVRNLEGDISNFEREIAIVNNTPPLTTEKVGPAQPNGDSPIEGVAKKADWPKLNVDLKREQLDTVEGAIFDSLAGKDEAVAFVGKMKAFNQISDRLADYFAKNPGRLNDLREKGSVLEAVQSELELLVGNRMPRWKKDLKVATETQESLNKLEERTKEQSEQLVALTARIKDLNESLAGLPERVKNLRNAYIGAADDLEKDLGNLCREVVGSEDMQYVGDFVNAYKDACKYNIVTEGGGQKEYDDPRIVLGMKLSAKKIEANFKENEVKEIVSAELGKRMSGGGLMAMFDPVEFIAGYCTNPAGLGANVKGYDQVKAQCLMKIQALEQFGFKPEEVSKYLKFGVAMKAVNDFTGEVKKISDWGFWQKVTSGKDVADVAMISDQVFWQVATDIAEGAEYKEKVPNAQQQIVNRLDGNIKAVKDYLGYLEKEKPFHTDYAFKDQIRASFEDYGDIASYSRLRPEPSVKITAEQKKRHAIAQFENSVQKSLAYTVKAMMTEEVLERSAMSRLTVFGRRCKMFDTIFNDQEKLRDNTDADGMKIEIDKNSRFRRDGLLPKTTDDNGFRFGELINKGLFDTLEA